MTPKALATGKMSMLECSAQVQDKVDRQQPLDRPFQRLSALFIGGPVDATARGEIELTAASRRQRGCRKMTTNRMTSADFVTAFATGWPEQEPHLMVLSLTTHKGVQDFALTKEQALLLAKTIKKTAAQLAPPKNV